jgi:hypothetical protein
VINGYTLQRDELNNWNCWQIQNLSFLADNLHATHILTPFSSKPRGSFAFDLIRIERFLPIFSIVRRIFELLFKTRKEKIEAKNELLDQFCELVWVKYLANRQTQLIFAVNPDKGLIKTCRILGIKLFDIQHGAISRRSGIEPLKNSNSKDGQLVNLVWSKWEHSFYDTQKIPSLIIGYPKCKTLYLEKSIDVLVMLTYDYPYTLKEESIIGEYLLDVTRTLLSTDFKIGIRPHPMTLRRITVGEYVKSINYFKDYLSSLLGSKKFKLCNPKLMGVAQDISRSKLVLTEPSSVLIEAAAQGVPALLPKSALEPIIQQSALRELGYISKVDKENIVQRVNTLKEISLPPLPFEPVDKDVRWLRQEILCNGQI